MKDQLSQFRKTIARDTPWRLFPFALLVLLLSSCAYPISREWRGEAQPGLTFSTVFNNPDAYIGSIVIWGGVITETYNRPEETDITVLETPLGYREKPEAEEYSRGRFIVRSQTFMDPAIYRPGRKITVAGEVIGKKKKALGGIEYTYPLLKAKEIHLWRHEYPPEYYYWGWYGPGPYW
jgi:outer membrane lipoprotein